MPPKKRYRKKNAKKQKRKYKISRPFGKVYTFRRGYYLGNITASNTVATYGAYNFKLSDLPDYSEFTNLFDEYMISKIVIQFTPNGINAAESVNLTDGWFMMVVDKDDDTTPTTYNTLLQYPNCKIRSYIKPHRLVFYPRVSTAIFNGGVTTAYGSNRRYIDCSSSGVPHYGFKYGIAQAGTVNSVIYNLWVTMTVKCRGLR